MRTDLPSGEETGGDVAFSAHGDAAARFRVFQSKIGVRSPDCTVPEDPHCLRLVGVELHAAKKACFSQGLGLMPAASTALQGVDGFPEKAARRLVFCCIS